MKVLVSTALAGLIALSFALPAPAASCNMSQAKGVATDFVKILETLPKTSTSWRFLGKDHDTDAIVGATVSMASCKYSQVANVTSLQPWCKYLPNDSDRC
jgi:hypothetical protein